MRTGYDGMTYDEILARTRLTADRIKYSGHIMCGNPNEEDERKMWEMIRAKHIGEGRNPLHPAFRLYPTWETFVRAGKPWHNHNEPGQRHMMWGDDSRRWEDNAFRKWPKTYRHSISMDRGLQPTQPSPSVGYGQIPAGVLMQMMAEANGGLGADWITPGSPERMIESYMESVRNNGIKIPGNIRIA